MRVPRPQVVRVAHPRLLRQGRSFSLIELLSVIAIMAVLITGAMFFVANYITWAKNTTDKEIYTVLNDELTRYKSEGGNISALTLGAPISDVFAAMQTPVTPAGMPSTFSHQFMATNYTYPGRSLTAIGNGQQYHFSRTGTYSTPDYSGWYSVTNGAGSTGTINLHITVSTPSVPWNVNSWDTTYAAAILNGTPGINIGAGSGSWPNNSAWVTEKAKTWYGSTNTQIVLSNGQSTTLTMSGLQPGNYTLQFWDGGDGIPPSACLFPWCVPYPSPTFTVAAGQTITVNATISYDPSQPAGTFYGWAIQW